jgi:tyrosyl-DNA phosphodiesterase-1
LIFTELDIEFHFANLTKSMTWSCQHCTFLNLDSDHECEICLLPRREIIDVDFEPQQESKKRARSPESGPNNQDAKLVKISTHYYDGELLLTKSPTNKSNFGFQDLMQPGIQRALLSAMCVDDVWLFGNLPLDIPTIVIRPRPRDVLQSQSQVLMTKNVKFIFPEIKDQYGCMHTKLIIFWFPDWIRIAIPSANLLDFDYETIENVIFVQDFPKVSGKHDKSHFILELEAALRDLGVNEVELNQLEGYDYSKAVGRIITSRPGSHPKEDYGLTRLASQTGKMNFPQTPIMITAQVNRN